MIEMDASSVVHDGKSIIIIIIKIKKINKNKIKK